MSGASVVPFLVSVTLTSMDRFRAECGVLVHSQLYPLTVVGTVVDIAALNGVAVVVQLGNDLSVGQLIGAGGVDLDGVLPDGAILGVSV